MKTVVVAGDSPIFVSLALEFQRALGGSQAVEVAVESSAASPWSVLRGRLRRSGWVRGLDQFAFKLFDVLWLRRRQMREARRGIGPDAALRRIEPINSPGGLAFLRQAQADVVVCIAPSIIGREALGLARCGFINVHPGVLPMYRGTGNLWAVVNRDWDNVGCTVHWMTEAIDAGKVILIERIRDIPGSLWDLHIASMRKGLASLASVLRSDALPGTSVDVAAGRARYYGWYGFADYARFRRALGERPST